MFTVQLSSHINTTLYKFIATYKKKTKRTPLIFRIFFVFRFKIIFFAKIAKNERKSDCFPASLKTGAAEKQNRLLFAALRINRNESQQSDQGKKSIIAKRVLQQKHSGDE